jgi:putative transposase
MHSFSSIYYHIVFSTKNRARFIDPAWESDLYAYIGGVINKKTCYPITIGGMPDHIHILVRMPTNINVADLVREIKKSTTKRLRELGGFLTHFEWQEGYSCFSVSYSVVPDVIRYIKNQVRHHRHITTEEEMERYYRMVGRHYTGDY